MPWGDKAVSPCVFTPVTADASGMSIDNGLVLIDGKLGVLPGYLYFRLVFTSPGTQDGGFVQPIVASMEIYDAYNALITPKNLASNTRDGYEASSFNPTPNKAAYRMFDGDDSTEWDGYNAAGYSSKWAQIKIPELKSFGKLILVGDDSWPTYTPIAGTLYGSTTGAFSGEQTALVSYSVPGWTTSQKREFVP